MNIFHTIIGANGEAFHFEFDQAKSAANKLKHGIDFVEVQRLWLDTALVEIPARSDDEARSVRSPHAVLARRRWHCMKAGEFDKRFDQGQDVTDVLDVAAARRPLQNMRRVNVDFPSWMVEALDREADRLGVTRQSLIKIWIAERLEQLAS